MPMELPQEARQEIIDEEHLRLLSLGHYINGGLYIGFASLFIFHFVFLGLMTAHPEWFQVPSGHPAPAPDGLMRIFAVVIGLFILAGWSFGGLNIYLGRCIKARTRRTLTLVVACLNAVCIPFGTVLGVLTLMVISRPSVRRLYGL